MTLGTIAISRAALLHTCTATTRLRNSSDLKQRSKLGHRIPVRQREVRKGNISAARGNHGSRG